MSINDKSHVINAILNLTAEEYDKIEIKTCFISKDKTKNEYYFSKAVELDSELEIFLIELIIDQLSGFQDKSSKSFPIQEYNKEFQLTDYIGKFNIEKSGEENKAVKQIDLLKKAISTDELENLKNAKFQIVTLTVDKEKVSFCFYKGVKRNAKARRMALFSSNEFKAVKTEMVEFGGKVSFFMDEKDVYIIDPKYFEYAFDYTDHIAEISNKNIEQITSMDFFPDDDTRKHFQKASGHQLLARSLANIKQETLNDVEKHFKERVNELRTIKHKRDKIKDAEKKNAFENDIGELNDLIRYIDFSNDKIIFNENDDPKPLLHFFQDKIVSSFLTKKIKLAMAVSVG
ncbi:Kiwa anti-phage protein KwaB-like domain-containing protein [Fredinandcohnia humi]